VKARNVLSAVALALIVPAVSNAQVTANHSFSVPVAKVVPNPCTPGAFELVTGTLKFAIQTVDSGASGFTIGAKVTSDGAGQDALATGTLLVVGRQPDYTYTYTTGFNASFLKRPADFGVTTGIVDWLTRGAGSTDSFLMRTEFDVNFTNGVPSVPVIKDLTVTCQ